MSAACSPILHLGERTKLATLARHIGPETVSATAERCCVREVDPERSQGWITVVELHGVGALQRIQVSASTDDALVCPGQRLVALRERAPASKAATVRLCSVDTRAQLVCQQLDNVDWWKWVSPYAVGIVTPTSVFHWSPFVQRTSSTTGDYLTTQAQHLVFQASPSPPVKAFDRAPGLTGARIVNYRISGDGKWALLIGLLPGTAHRPKLPKGFLQLHSYAQMKSQPLEAHAAAFATIKVPSRLAPAHVVVLAQRVCKGPGEIVSRLYMTELGVNTPGAVKRQVELNFPPGFDDDYPIGVLIGMKYQLVYTVTHWGLLWVHDCESLSTLHYSRISSQPVFHCVPSLQGGLLAINRSGKVISVEINESTIVSFVHGQLKNPTVASSLANRVAAAAKQRGVPKQPQMYPQQAPQQIQQQQQQQQQLQQQQQQLQQQQLQQQQRLQQMQYEQQQAQLKHYQQQQLEQQRQQQQQHAQQQQKALDKQAHQRFEQLFAAGAFKEAAEVVATSTCQSPPLRTVTTMERFKVASAEPSATVDRPPLLIYFAVLLSKGSLYPSESLEWTKLLYQMRRRDLLELFWREGKIMASRGLGDMLKVLGAADIAQEVYKALELQSKK